MRTHTPPPLSCCFLSYSSRMAHLFFFPPRQKPPRYLFSLSGALSFPKPESSPFPGPNPALFPPPANRSQTDMVSFLRQRRRRRMVLPNRPFSPEFPSLVIFFALCLRPSAGFVLPSTPRNPLLSFYGVNSSFPFCLPARSSSYFSRKRLPPPPPSFDDIIPNDEKSFWRGICSPLPRKRDSSPRPFLSADYFFSRFATTVPTPSPQQKIERKCCGISFRKAGCVASVFLFSPPVRRILHPQNCYLFQYVGNVTRISPLKG